MNIADNITLKPMIDRSSKAAALSTYEDKAKFMGRLMDQEEKIVDKSLETVKELSKTEQEYQEISNKTGEIP